MSSEIFHPFLKKKQDWSLYSFLKKNVGTKTHLATKFSFFYRPIKKTIFLNKFLFKALLIRILYFFEKIDNNKFSQ